MLTAGAVSLLLLRPAPHRTSIAQLELSAREDAPPLDFARVEAWLASDWLVDAAVDALSDRARRALGGRDGDPRQALRQACSFQRFERQPLIDIRVQLPGEAAAEVANTVARVLIDAFARNRAAASPVRGTVTEAHLRGLDAAIAAAADGHRDDLLALRAALARKLALDREQARWSGWSARVRAEAR